MGFKPFTFALTLNLVYQTLKKVTKEWTLCEFEV